MSTYQGRTVTIVRNAQQGDGGFNQNKDQAQNKDQVLIREQDGSEKVVLRSDVTN